MDILYKYFVIIHLTCAIIFLGYIFTDVILLTPLKKILNEDTSKHIFETISKRGVKIMPTCVVLLVLSGGAMSSRWFNSEIGFFETTLQQLLAIKILLALLIVIMVAISLSFKFFIKKPNPLAKVIHPIALVLGGFIVIFAKLAFY